MMFPVEMDVDIEEEPAGLVYFLRLLEASRGPVRFAGRMWLEMVQGHGLRFLALRRPGEVVPEALMEAFCQAVRQHYQPRYVLRSGVAARQLADGYMAYVCWPEGQVEEEQVHPPAWKPESFDLLQQLREAGDDA